METYGSGHPLAMRKTIAQGRKKQRKPTNSLVDEAAYKWFVDQRSHSVPISGRAKALRVSSLEVHRRHRKFQASGGCLSAFKKTHCLHVQGENLSAGSACVSSYVDGLQIQLEESRACVRSRFTMLMKRPFTGKLYHGRRLLQPLSKSKLLEEKNVNKEYLFSCAATLPEVTNRSLCSLVNTETLDA